MKISDPISTMWSLCMTCIGKRWRHRWLLIVLVFLLFSLFPSVYGAVEIPWSDVFSESNPSTPVPTSLPETVRSIAWTILWFVKIALSWVALIYMVIMGVMIIVNSENPSEVKKQSTQILYTALGFIFLNVPWTLYQAIVWGGNRVITPGSWRDVEPWSSIFYNLLYVQDFRDGIINFLSVFIFGLAVLMFTWAVFLILTSGSDDAWRKAGRDRILWWILGLLSVAFLQAWIRIISIGQVTGASGSIASVAGQLISLALFFAWPVAIFFLIFGAYYVITSAGDDAQAKKWKAIIINTFIATLILLWLYTFLNDLVQFTL